MTIEAKAVKRFAPGEWVTEAERESDNASSGFWIVVAKRPRHPLPKDAFVITSLEQWLAQTSASTSSVERIRLAGVLDRGDLGGVTIG